MEEARFYLDALMEGVELHPLIGGQAAVYSTRCPGKTAANEDAAVIVPINEHAAVLAVADGMGGGPSGEQASALALATLAESLNNGALEGETLPTAILKGIDAANRKIQETHPNAATTLVVVEIQQGEIRPYHVGDSMILAFSSRGRLKLQTVMHSPVGYALEAGILNEVEAMHHQHRHVVSNVVGCPEMRVEIGSPLRLRPHDTVVLASDGLFDNLHVEEVVNRLRRVNLAKCLQQVAGDAVRRMTHHEAPAPCKPDDLTIVAFRPTKR
ncbi:MAG: protein phosphatase 2C domain-containing protein [Planctomycetes bacterium]|nr:protein phosphatase 2C domain-containing protein [Planctomycetota bacterium]